MDYKMIQLSDFVIAPSDVLQNMRIDDEDGTYQEIIEELLVQVLPIAKPKAIYRMVKVENNTGSQVTIGGVPIHYEFVAQNLKDNSRVFAYVATCGTEMENWSHTLSDEIEKYVADAIKLTALSAVRKKLFSEVKELFFPHTTMSTMNPGSLKEWPISEQKQLFAMIGNVESLLGVHLTQSFLMLPSKSVSGLFFASEKGHKNCQYCPMENCPNRSAEKIYS